MINLLPPQEKEHLLLEKHKKLAIILGNIVLISLICLALVLFYLKFYILKEISQQKFILQEAEKKYQSSGLMEFKEIVKKHNEDLVKTDNFYKKEMYFSSVLKIISEVKRPSGLYLTDISINNTKEGDKVKVTISGFSGTRDDLLVFKGNIENNKSIENTYFPPDNWIKASDINFHLTFEIKASI